MNNKDAWYHAPVLLEESMISLAIKPHGVYVDCTLGGGGHFQSLIDRLSPGAIAIGIDRDPEAIEWCEQYIDRKEVKVLIRQELFSRFDRVLDELNIHEADGIFMDLGLSSRQITAENRGFSYMKNVDLDMRMNPKDSVTASGILQNATKEEMARIFSEFGDIRNPLRMVDTILRYREKNSLNTTDDLKNCLKKEYGDGLTIKALAKLFQSLRIAVNDELSELCRCCERSVERLGVAGRLAIISYHSLEDRFVKNFMRDAEKTCRCPPTMPLCICGKKRSLKRINTKAIVASEAEVERNRASRSARLRVAEKVMDF
jgi:16S rRNA (cytosine1402-N4)-methyltransferase